MTALAVPKHYTIPPHESMHSSPHSASKEPPLVLHIKTEDFEKHLAWLPPNKQEGVRQALSKYSNGRLIKLDKEALDASTKGLNSYERNEFAKIFFAKTVSLETVVSRFHKGPAPKDTGRFTPEPGPQVHRPGPEGHRPPSTFQGSGPGGVGKNADFFPPHGPQGARSQGPAFAANFAATSFGRGAQGQESPFFMHTQPPPRPAGAPKKPGQKQESGPVPAGAGPSKPETAPAGHGNAPEEHENAPAQDKSVLKNLKEFVMSPMGAALTGAAGATALMGLITLAASGSSGTSDIPPPPNAPLPS